MNLINFSILALRLSFFIFSSEYDLAILIIFHLRIKLTDFPFSSKLFAEFSVVSVPRVLKNICLAILSLMVPTVIPM